MRRLVFPLGTVLAACSGDAEDLDSGSGAAETGDATTDDEADGARLDVGGGVGSSSGGPSDDGGEVEGGGGSGGSDDASGDGSGGESDETMACLPALVFMALDGHLQELRASTGLMAAQPSANQPIGFLLAPGLPLPPATAIRYANVPGLPCADPTVHPPVCDGAHCYQVECTGNGTEWMTLLWNESPIDDEQWRIEHVWVLSSWNEAEPGIEFAIASDGRTHAGANASMLAHGRIIDSGMHVIEQYPMLSEVGEVWLTFVWENDVFAGDLRIGDFLVARVDDMGHLRPTGACPEPET